MKRLGIKSVRDAVLGAIDSDRRATIFEELKSHGARIYVLAGAIRDAIASYEHGNVPRVPRDYDFVVSDISREQFYGLLSSQGNRNRHGGIVLQDAALPTWDIWRMEDTVGIRKTAAPCSIENVLRSFSLDCNAIALDMETGIFLDAGAIRAIKQRRIDFVAGAIRHSANTFAAKALLLQMRLQYSPSRDLDHFALTHLSIGHLQHEVSKVFPGFRELRITS